MSPEPVPLRVLVVEDNPDARDNLVLLLGLEGHAASQAENGREALERLRAGPRPDLILLDLSMPVMDGWQFRRQQRQDPALASIPVIVLTAHEDEAVGEDAVGDVGYLRKPVDSAELLRVLRRFVAPRRPGVLVVDDEEGVRKMLGMALRHHGFVPLLAGTGEEAVELYRRHRGQVDVALLDVQMPGLDGPHTLDALRALEPTVLAVFMSGHTGSYSEADLRARGAACVLPKPFKLAELAGTIRRVLASLLPGEAG